MLTLPSYSTENWKSNMMTLIWDLIFQNFDMAFPMFFLFLENSEKAEATTASVYFLDVLSLC